MKRGTLAPTFGTVVMTGAAGRVATLVRPLLAAHCRELRLLDVRPVTVFLPCETPMHVKLEDADVLTPAMTKAEAVIHLGGLAEDATWPDLVKMNIEGTANVFAAAQAKGIKRVVYASSIGARGFFRDTAQLPAGAPFRPDNHHAASKAAGELVARMYAEKFGMQVTCLRIGQVSVSRDDVPAGMWTGADDLARLILAALHPLRTSFRAIDTIAPERRAIFPNRQVRQMQFRWRGRNLPHRAQTAAEAPHS
ncbi:NAD(P)-dependent oxidoreductase [Pacificimonas sp. WHA3]|uniref:NAD(P)-dependent oxidoreductase n=1 Tax=Pacificimonas pallii TaxID=2827236 RepID=A0ABS6SFL3_9SPHN|nr:NAD(P)-dependent oxidoreductase [Pacificimonas pallii]MBV7257199.1 NAD(P)-dependent oxidoreductase [Pacificimonas pallii]